jgi:CheY-like chemotaxis protein
MGNILVVENEAQNIVAIKTFLESGGHQILFAKSADGAKILMQAASFDLLICSAHLNSGTVFDLLKFVKSDPDRRATLFVCLCVSPTDLAKSVDGIMQATALLLGADKYIMQDVFDAEQFRTQLESLLPMHQRPQRT